MSLDITKIRAEFPALEQKIYGNDLVYLDSAATTLKPKAVIDRLTKFYSFEASNVHRGAHFLSDRATELYEKAREKVADFINATSSKEIIFVRGTTEGINLLASTLGEALNEGDEILISELEHHANIVPWQILAKHKKLSIKVLPINENGDISELTLRSSIGTKTKILALTHASNHLGNVVDIENLTKVAHEFNLKVVIDGAQSIGKIPIDVKALNVDFYVFSGHKMFAPFGIGVVYGKEALLKSLPPYQGGGSMISKVSFYETTFNDIPFRFEAGTPNIGGAVALGSAIDFIEQIGFKSIERYENCLIESFNHEVAKIEELLLLGTKASSKIPIFAFNLKGIHASDVGSILNQQGIAVRAGHHCTQPLLQKLNINGSIRASFSIYNTEQEIKSLVKGLMKAKELLK